MKRQLILFSVLFLSIISIQAGGFVSDGINYNITSTVVPYSVCVAAGESYTGDVMIPSTVSHNDTIYSVTAIFSNAFNGSSGLTSVSIPNSVSSIGEGAFYGCSGLTSIDLDPTNQHFVFSDGILYTVSQNMVIYCLTNKTGKINIPETVGVIGPGAFNGCNGITSVSIPNTVTFVGSQAFSNCTNLVTVVMGDSTNTGMRTAINIQPTAFTGCTGLTSLSLYVPFTSYNSPFQDLPSLKILAIGNSVTTIDNLSFSTLPGLTKVILGRADLSPSSLLVYAGAFNASANLETLNLNCNLEVISYSTDAISSFSKISVLSIGDKVSLIGDKAFMGAKNLKSVRIPNAVASIGQSAFASCTSLNNVTLGSSVTSLGSGVFTDCGSLLDIQVDNANTTYSSIDGVVFSKDGQTLFQYPMGRNGGYEIPASVKTVGTAAFLSCKGLQSVAIPQRITSIQSLAFANCSGLTSVSIGHVDSISSSVVTIASNAFSGCPAVTKLGLNKTFSFPNGDSPFKNMNLVTRLLIGNGVTSIPDYTFSGCTGLKTVGIGQSNSVVNTVMTVSEYAFDGCTNFTTLELNRNINTNGYQSPFLTISNLSVGNGVVFIGDQIFSQCTHLTSVRLSSFVKKIGDNAFQSCSNLQSVSFPGINSLGQGAFSNCTALTSIDIPNSVKIIQPMTFNACTALSSLSLGDSIGAIQDNAFTGCGMLNSLVLPNTVKTIGTYTFSGCSGLTSVEFGTSLTSIAPYAFFGCKLLQSVQFPSSLTGISDNAFEGCTGLLSLFIPSTIAAVGASAFANCSGITTLTIGDAKNPGSPLICSVFPFEGCTGVTSLILNKNIVDDPYSSPFMSLKSLKSVTISNRVSHLNTFAFYGCSKLISVTIPNSVASIGEAAFQDCSLLVDIKLPIDIVNLPNQIFSGCNSLKSLYIPFGVTSIGSYAFYQCSHLASITIPKSVIVIGPLAFSGCTGLTELSSAPLNPVPVGTNCFDGVSLLTCKLFVPSSSRTGYQMADQWKDFKSIVEKDIKDSIQAPDSVSSVVKTVTISAGGLLSALTPTELVTVNKLIISGSMNSADFSTICRMKVLYILDLAKVTIQSNAIPSNAFSGMKSLASVIFPSGTTSIGARAFENCNGLITITLPSGLTSIGSSAFANCSGLMMVTLPSSMTIIKSSAFYACSRLFVINIPSSVTTIEGNAFALCNSLTTINLPESITSIGEYAFAGCSGLRSITIPSYVKYLSDGLFSDCYSLTSISLPSSLSSIASGQVFANCYDLRSIYNYQKVPLVLTAPVIFFGVNTGSCILYVPAGSLKAYQQAYQWRDFVNIREMINTDVSLQTSQSVSFYPNPANEGFQIRGLTESGILTLTNLNGDVFFTKQVTGDEYISISTFPEGIYIARIVTQRFSLERKIIKK